MIRANLNDKMPPELQPLVDATLQLRYLAQRLGSPEVADAWKRTRAMLISATLEWGARNQIQ